MINLVDKILDKINKLGLSNLSFDERSYFKLFLKEQIID